MKNSLGDYARLQHIYEAIIEIESYSQEDSFEVFQSDLMKQRACVNLLEIIGEVAKHISEWMKTTYSEIEWREITDLRNLLIHEYFGIDTKIVWDIIKNDLPNLKIKIYDILNQLSP
jgi:uncharacterized protein with HEPN domain